MKWGKPGRRTGPTTRLGVHLGLRGRLLAVLAAAGVCGAAVFCTLWAQEYRFWLFCQRFPSLSWDEAAFAQTLRVQAAHTYLPQDSTGQSNPDLDAFFELRDPYTSVYLYSAEDGYFLCGAYAEIMDDLSYRGLFDLGYYVTSGRSEMYYSEVMQFENCKAEVMIYSYHRARTVYPYFAFCLAAGILAFLWPVLRFMRRKMRQILRLKESILSMAAGDLDQPVPACGQDEIGVLARELDRLRLALDENIRLEAQSRKANQDLIAAMSHDLRTPLTILNGYLEILSRGHGDAQLRADYLARCLRKTADLKEMTDKMFEYSLVFSNQMEPHFTSISLASLQNDLREHCDFIRLAGFTVQETYSDASGTLRGDETMLKRVFTNLFSNILKYGDKSAPVQVGCAVCQGHFQVSLSNAIRRDQEQIESNRIGLKSVGQILRLHGGSLFWSGEGTEGFLVVLRLKLGGAGA